MDAEDVLYMWDEEHGQNLPGSTGRRYAGLERLAVVQQQVSMINFDQSQHCPTAIIHGMFGTGQSFRRSEQAVLRLDFVQDRWHQYFSNN